MLQTSQSLKDYVGSDYFKGFGREEKKNTTTLFINFK